ncbi:MAG: 50S ribosomal protein L6, partial [Candidatus Eremiobacteraeota bacterium]|nr:50S ribosomal protein L6 [Candidatus Eremiobacteraeota bacterium]
MSRIGKLPLTVPEKVNVEVGDSRVIVRGPKGELVQPVLALVEVNVQDGHVLVTRKNDQRNARAAHGLTRTLVANMLEGVTKGFRKSLEIQGVGYRVAKAGENLN